MALIVIKLSFPSKKPIIRSDNLEDISIIQGKIENLFGKAKDIGIKAIHLEVVTKNEKDYGFRKVRI